MRVRQQGVWNLVNPWRTGNVTPRRQAPPKPIKPSAYSRFGHVFFDRLKAGVLKGATHVETPLLRDGVRYYGCLPVQYFGDQFVGLKIKTLPGEPDIQKRVAQLFSTRWAPVMSALQMSGATSGLPGPYEAISHVKPIFRTVGDEHELVGFAVAFQFMRIIQIPMGAKPTNAEVSTAEALDKGLDEYVARHRLSA